MQKPFLKWAGGKHKLVPHIAPLLQGQRLIEPFAGSCALYLGTDFSQGLLNDINGDLIALYKRLQKPDSDDFIDSVQNHHFRQEDNTEDAFKDKRTRFNALTIGEEERAALFVYLNRHAFNGLCRYNASGGFNVPYGRYKSPGFPGDAMRAFAKRVQEDDVTFTSTGFEETMNKAHPGDVIYADPPYFPLSVTSAFTSYSKESFGLTQQEQLARAAQQAALNGTRVVVSNHATDMCLSLYQDHGADVSRRLDVQRSVSAKGDKRTKAPEVLAVFEPK